MFQGRKGVGAGLGVRSCPCNIRSVTNPPSHCVCVCFDVGHTSQGSAQEAGILENLLASAEARADARSAEVTQLQGV